MISFNGGEIYDMYHEKISKNRLQCRSFAAFLTKPFSAVFTARPSSDSEIVTEHDTEEVKHYSSIVKIPYKVVPDVTAFLKSEPVKVLVVNYENKEHLRDYLEKTADFADGKINRFFSSNEYLEHVAPGIDKGSAVRFLCEYTGIPLCNTIAAGDAENDISMIRATPYRLCYEKCRRRSEAGC